MKYEANKSHKGAENRCDAYKRQVEERNAKQKA